ncbi:pirin family protein [Neptuniibacter sp. 2_MG-2023]|uniref:pirin family protein n=1 Tax=Neptuniibacter sp. 2_MG-2023 TaxID=3062671 RepID=UPI0026E2F182|nr:pirin family protein [Neptuniibacter sp. 2_MG-2023]MDO6512737.1 pirin family protein [Neptuniibacter sp. 2_MG-2023]
MISRDPKREINRVIPAVDSRDGAGVLLKRSIGRNPSARLDPFLMLDAFSSDNPDDYMAGFPPHPHRGFETVTYMLNGHMIHKDHLGNEGELRSGGVQWMTAGKGVVHEERPVAIEGLMRGFQLWINLPAKDKMKPAAYQHIEPEDIPHIELMGGAALKLIAGSLTLDDITYQGPICVEETQPLYVDLQLQPGTTVELPIPSSHNAFIYLFEGKATVEGQPLLIDAANRLSTGSRVSITTAESDADKPITRLLLLAGKPIGEPVAQYGPFVMNTMAEVEQAIADYRADRLVD